MTFANFQRRFFCYVTFTLITQVTCNSLSTTRICTGTALFLTLQRSVSFGIYSSPVILRGGGEEGYDEDECDGGEGEVERVATSVSPRASALSRLNHYTVSVLQLEAKVLWVVFQGLITATAPVTSHKLEVFVRFIPRKVSSTSCLRIRHSRKSVAHPRTHTRCSRSTLDTSRSHLQKEKEREE